MEQMFNLKFYGHFSLFEISTMTAEERSWWIERINKENKALHDQSQRSQRK